MTWKMPEWMEKYCVGEYLIYDKQQIETHMNTGSNVNMFNNAPLALMVMGTKSKVELLEKLHSDGLLCEKKLLNRMES